MKSHVDAILAKCASMIYALNLLRNHGLNQDGSQRVFQAKVVYRITYASSSWCGMASNEEHRRLLTLSLTNLKSMVITLQMVKTFKRFVTLQTKDFIKIQNNPQHVLYKLLPVKKQTTYDLRRRGHDYNLPVKDDRNFISRTLYKFI